MAELNGEAIDLSTSIYLRFWLGFVSEVVDIGLESGLHINIREDKYIKPTTLLYTIDHLVESIVGISDCLDQSPAIQAVG